MVRVHVSSMDAQQGEIIAERVLKCLMKLPEQRFVYSTRVHQASNIFRGQESLHPQTNFTILTEIQYLCTSGFGLATRCDFDPRSRFQKNGPILNLIS